MLLESPLCFEKDGGWIGAYEERGFLEGLSYGLPILGDERALPQHVAWIRDLS